VLTKSQKLFITKKSYSNAQKHPCGQTNMDKTKLHVLMRSPNPAPHHTQWVHVAKNKTQQRIKLAKKHFMGSQEVSAQHNHIANICVLLCAVKSKKKGGQNGRHVVTRGRHLSTFLFVHISFGPHFHFFLSTFLLLTRGRISMRHPTNSMRVFQRFNK